MANGTATKSFWRNSLLLGILGALIVAGVHIIGLDYRAELHAVNWRFRNHSATKSLDNIVHVDIDDGSLEQLGRWPWPRENLAGLIESVSQCGAKNVVLDIILPTPEKVRYQNPAAEISRWDREAAAADAQAMPIFDDALLAHAIRTGKNVFTPMHVDIFTNDSAIPEPAEYKKLQQAIAKILRENPTASFHKIIAEALAEDQDLDKKTLAKKYLRQRAIRAISRFSLAGNFAENLKICQSEMTPPWPTLAEAAYGSGFVTFIPDADSVARRIPLLTKCNDKFYPQLAFAVAAKTFAAQHGKGVTISSLPDYITLMGKDSTLLKIPVDPAGSMLIDWARWSWLDEAGKVGEGHLSAAYVAEIWRIGKSLKQLDTLAQAKRMQFLRMGFTDDFFPELTQKLAGLVGQADDAYKARLNAEGLFLWSQLFAPATGPSQADVEKLHQAEAALESQVQKLSAELVAKLRHPTTFEKFTAGSEIQAEKILKILDSIPAERKRLELRRSERISQVRAKVEGKICFIGSTSTGAPDFVPTPLDARTPGVVVHSNIVNTIMSGSFIHQSSLATNLLTIIIVGAIVAFIAATRPVLQAALAMLILAGGYYVFNAYILFGLWKYWLILIAPLGSMLASFLVVTAYRQLTEERAKRQIKDMFAHALSPALVDRLLEDPSLAQLGGHSRKLSFLFSDLGGFTTLSEQLGPQETVLLLNRYFDGVTDVIQNRRGGYLNKFLGDGIFAFFGAPVFQDDHSARAIQTAVDCQQAVAALNAQLEAEGHKARLTVRIGITTGEAMVGNCGSSERMDYTAIGDNVNLAARLEAANKFFGSNILVDEPTWLEGGQTEENEKLLARPLGKIIVTGQVKPLWIWEIRGRIADADPAQVQAMQDFAGAIENFKQREYTQAVELLGACLIAMPGDKPTAHYMDLCRQGLTLPPGQDPVPIRSGEKGVDRIALPWEVLDND